MNPSRGPAADSEYLGKAWELVRRWPKMSGPDKLAWRFLRIESKGGRYTVKTNLLAIAEDQNVSADAAADRLLNLKNKWGLIDYRIDEATGLYLVDLLDAREAVRLKTVKVDPQLLLYSEEYEDQPGTWEPTTVSFVTTSGQSLAHVGQGSPPAPRAISEWAEDPPEEPPRSPRNLPEDPPSRTSDFKKENKSPTSDLKTLEHRSLTTSALAASRGSSGGSSDPDAIELDRQAREIRREQGLDKRDAPPTIGMALIARALSGPHKTPMQRQRELDEYVAYIRAEVRCEKLYDAPVEMLAAAVIAKRIPDGEVRRLIAKLNRVDQAEGLHSRSSYFVSGVRNLFRWNGLDWDDNEFRPKRKPK